MLYFLNTPYPFFLNKRETFWVIALIGIFVFVICLLLRPFGLSAYPIPKLLLLSLINGLVVFFSLLISQALFSHFNRGQDEENWTVLKEIIVYFWHLLMLSIIIFLFNYFLDPAEGKASDWFLFSMTRPLIASLIIIPLIILLKRNFILQKNVRDQLKINKIIDTKIKVEVSTDVQIEMASNDKQDNLKLSAEDVVFLKASENYVEVTYLDGSGLDTVLLRNTLKNIRKEIKDYPEFFQCHRSYIINLDMVEFFSGNSKGYLVTLENVADKVPVARSSIEKFKQALSNISN